jgi:predicted nucleotidyltransferase
MHDCGRTSVLRMFESIISYTMRLTPKEIEIIQSWLKQQPVCRAYLFGSYARGEADESSDVDLLLELDYSTHIGLRFVEMQWEIEEKLGRPVDLVAQDALSGNLKPYVDRDKQLIYEREAW